MNQNLIIKVCGMKDPHNIRFLNASGVVDWMGMIFYERSKRYVGDGFEINGTHNFRKVGVFVNNTLEYIDEKVKKYQLELVQLHGTESPIICKEIRTKGVQVIKAFSVDDSFDFDACRPYIEVVDYFLFDTKGIHPGGNGILFDWSLLANYPYDVPFLLAGGIGPVHIQDIKNFNHPRWIGIDVNSQFETSPGKKNIEKIKKFYDELRR